MSKVIVSLSITLDGFCNHNHVVVDDEWHQYALEQIDTAGALVFGRTTYQLFESYWPGIAAHGQGSDAYIGLARRIDTIPKILFSSTVKNPGWNTDLVQGNVEEHLVDLRQRLVGNLVVLGSISLVQQLVAHGLVDEYQFFVQPLLAGRGRPLFDSVRGLDAMRFLQLTGHRILGSGVTILTYIPKG